MAIRAILMHYHPNDNVSDCTQDDSRGINETSVNIVISRKTTFYKYEAHYQIDYQSAIN